MKCDRCKKIVSSGMWHKNEKGKIVWGCFDCDSIKDYFKRKDRKELGK